MDKYFFEDYKQQKLKKSRKSNQYLYNLQPHEINHKKLHQADSIVKKYLIIKIIIKIIQIKNQDLSKLKEF